jgi:endonuclease/exonuclease/phosphatase (EEP) superfamily protein YafD
LVSHVDEAQDGQMADIVGGDFNCTPGSPLYQEIATHFGASVLQLAGAAPFVTWDGLSTRADAGQTLDYIFIRGRMPFQQFQATAHVAFEAKSLEKRLSDHLGIEAVINLNSWASPERGLGALAESAE